MPNAKILYLDIENAPSLGWTWGPKWETSIIDMEADFYLLSFAWKWEDERKIHVLGLDDFPGFSRDRTNDRQLTKALWRLMDEADVIVAHNGDQFDIKKSNTRFVTHGLPPPSPFKTIDTLKIARRVFRFDSNKLDDLGRCLGLGRKMPTEGFTLWQSCMRGDAAAWAKMKSYNVQDVALLVKVYKLLFTWAPNHPNIARREQSCPRCGSQEVQKRGFSYTLLKRKQRYQCMTCRGWYEGPAKKEIV